MADPIQVIVAGGSPLLRAGLVETLAQHEAIRVLGDANDLAGAAQWLARLAPGVLVVYLERPSRAAPQLADAVAAAPPLAGCLVLTGSRDLADLLAALGERILGYGVLDTLQPRDLVTAVTIVGRGEMWLCPWSIQLLLARALEGPNPLPVAAASAPASLDLSSRETEVLQLLAKGKGEQEMSEALFLSRNTVKTYVRRIREKLGVSSRSDALRVAYQLGIIADRRQVSREPKAVQASHAMAGPRPGTRGRSA